MSDLQTRDVSEADIIPMTEEEFAHCDKAQGTHVIHHNDRYWKQTFPGFYQPIHYMARLSYEQATCPGLWHWGFQATLRAEDAKLANASLPVHLLTDLKDYDLNSLSSNRRSQIRKSKKLVEFVEITGPNLFKEQGYEVIVSAVKRTGYGDIKKYLDEITYFSFGRWFVVAGLIDGKLGGFITGFAINETAYLDRVHVATESLSTCISPGLHFEFVQLCRRSGKISEIVHSLHSREDQALCTFKESMGFPVEHIPSKLKINPIMGKFIRGSYPDKYYRLTGQE